MPANMNRLRDLVTKFWLSLSHCQQTTSGAAKGKTPPVYKYFNQFIACDLLLDAGIPCKIWGGGVFTCHGLPTFVADTFLLVNDWEKAAQALEAQGYLRTKHCRRYSYIPELSGANSCRLVSGVWASEKFNVLFRESSIREIPGLLDGNDFVCCGVVLLLAQHWGYPLPESVTHLETAIPELDEFFDHVVARWMETEEDDYRLRKVLNQYIDDCVNYFDYFWTVEFEKAIRMEHRQFYFDLLARGRGGRIDRGSPECLRYHKNIRDQILLGNHEPAIIEGLDRTRYEPPTVGDRVVITLPVEEISHNSRQEKRVSRNPLGRISVTCNCKIFRGNLVKQ